MLKKSHKYEYPFLGKDEVYTYGFLSQEDPYNATKDEILRTKWMEEAKMLYGDFKPGSVKKSISEISKSKLMDIVETMKKLLLSDWNDVNFVIGSKLLFFYISIIFIANPNDFIEIKFDLSTIDTLQGLHAYMNTLLNSNDELTMYCLRKVSTYWGFKENNFVYYMIAPPWVKIVVVTLIIIWNTLFIFHQKQNDVIN